MKSACRADTPPWERSYSGEIMEVSMRVSKFVFGAALLLFANGQIVNADLLMLLEGDVASGKVAVDSSGNGNHAIYLGSAGGTDAGRAGGALNFNADLSYMLTHQADVGTSAISASPATAATAFAGINDTQEYSIGFWLSGGDTNPRNSSVFWADGVTPNGGNRAIQTHVTWSNSQIYLDQGGCCDADTQRVNGALDEEYIKGSVGEEWTHYTFTAGLEDDVPYRRIYVDGALFLETESSAGNAEVPIIDNFYVASDNGAGNQWEGRLDDFFVANNMLSSDDVDTLYQSSAREFFGVTGTPDPVQAQFIVNKDTLGTHSLSGELSNVVMSEPQLTQGLTQYWYDANLSGNAEAFLEAGDTGSDAAPLVAPAFVAAETWWAGNQNPDLITDRPLERYPSTGLAGTRFAGSTGEDNYAVRLKGEIFIEENGDFVLRDGIDDFTMIAIDMDGNGELDGVADLVNDDVSPNGGPPGLVLFGEPSGDILVLDNDWSNLDGSGNPPDFNAVATFDNIAAGGEWREIEIWMSEGGGGDGGILYMGSLSDPDIFDDLSEDALTQEQIDNYTVPAENLRSLASVIESADAGAALDTTLEYVLQVQADGTNDAIAVEDGGGVFNTTLDVTGAAIRIDAEEGIAEGTSYHIIDADNIMGSFDLLADNPSMWAFNPATGMLTYGGGGLCDPNSQGDLDGNGMVEFADFLVLSGNFGNAATSHTEGDIDCSGTVDFADFLALSANFGQSVGAAQSVPEPSSFALFGLAALVGGLVRRRR